MQPLATAAATASEWEQAASAPGERIATSSRTSVELDLAVGGGAERGHRQRRHTAPAFDLDEFGLRLGVGIAASNLLEFFVELRTGQFAIDARFRQRPLNRLPHIFERADIVIVRELLQCTLNPHARLRILKPRDHPHLLCLELIDVALETDEVLFRLFGFARE